MRSQKQYLYPATLVMLAFIVGGCDNPQPTFDAVTDAPTATTTSTPTGTPTPTPAPMPAPPLGDPGHTGAVDQELPIAFEPKWLSPSFLGMGNYQVDWRVVTDDEIVVVAGSSASLNRGIAPILTSFNSGDNSTLYAFRLADGGQIWSYDTNGVLMGTPQIADGSVYAVTRQRATAGEEAFASKIHCLSAEDGSLVWQHILPKSHTGALTVQDGVVVLLAGTVDVKNGKLAIPWEEESPIQALGFDANTGEPLWSTPLLNKNSFSLDAPAAADGLAFVTDGDYLYALDLQTGQQLWQRDREGEEGTSPSQGFSGALVAAEGRLFAAVRHTVPDYSSYYNSIYAFNAASGEILWHYEMASTQTSGHHEVMSYHLDKLFIWETWNQGDDPFHGLVAVSALDGSEVWHTKLDTSIEYPPIIGNNGRMLVSSYGGCWLLEESTGRILWSGDRKYVSELGVSYAQPWGPTFTYGITYPNPPREEWLPNEWALDSRGESVLLAEFETWMSVPALSDGVVIGVARHPEHESKYYGLRLIAYGADTTPPDARISEIGLGRRNIQLLDIFGTAYDYNLKEWSLELGKGTPPSDWEVLHHDTNATQTFLANLRIGGNPRQIGDGDWTLRLTVTDTAGLTGSDEWTFTNDWTAPSVVITEPEDVTTITAGSFTLTGTASDTNGIDQVRITFDGGKTFKPANGTQAWTLPIAVTPAMEGKSVTYYAEATDTFGNVGRSNSVTLTFPKFQVGLQASGRRLVSTRSMFVDKAIDIDDGDGINQRWENAAMQLIMPIMELDEEEDWLNQFHENIIGQHTKPKYPMVYFVRVTGYTPDSYQKVSAEYPTYILFYIVFGWAKDYGAVGGGFEAHRGDSENILMAWRVTSETTAELEWVRTSSHKDVNRHHGLWNAWQRSCTLANVASNADVTGDTEMMCSTLEFEADGRLVLYPGEDKHALYPNADMCSNDVNLLTFGYGEDCGWDPLTVNGKLVPGQWKDSDFDQDNRYLGNGRWLFEAYNVGEPDPNRKYQLIDFLDQPDTWRGLTDAQKKALTGLYPNEAVWSGTAGKRAEWDPPDGSTLKAGNTGGGDFCGGLQPGGDAGEPKVCSSKLGGALGQADDWSAKDPPDLISDAMDARYQVTIKTGDRERAGTDAMISLALSHNGEFGDTIEVYSGGKFYLPPLVFNFNPIKAPYPYVGSFERGDTDYIYLDDNKAGEITGIQLSQDDTGEGPGWFVEQVMVQDLLTGKVWLAMPYKWLATDESPNTTSAYLELSSYFPGSVSEIEYQVIVATGDKQDAGTDGDVSITLIADDGYSSGPHTLDNEDSNDFERNTLGYYTAPSPDVGQLATLRVELKSTGDHPEWYCREVTVRDIMTGQVWVFPVESWLGKGNGPLSVDVPPKD